MRINKVDGKKPTESTKFEVELDKNIVDQIMAMENHTKIPKSELVTTAMKRFISSHKDYFPDDYWK